MAKIVISKEKCDLCGKCIDACPFGSIQEINDEIVINESCRICRLCIKNCPNGAITLEEEKIKQVDKSKWQGIMVFVEYVDGKIHPVVYELLGKAKELADKISQPVYAIFIGDKITQDANELISYGVDKVFVYQHKELEYFRADVYTNIMEHCINMVKPSIVLIGATSIGRSLAPRTATRFRTGLTADCTKLEVRENSDLVQIRPAFGGNIMAQIVTQNTRPQFATVRYKVMEKAKCVQNNKGIVEEVPLKESDVCNKLLKSGMEVLKVINKESKLGISDADIIVAAGRGIKKKEDLQMIEELAELLGAQTACTRPLIEAGWMPYDKQIGLSGRTVKPQLIIACGISGAVQFTAAMNSSQCIFAINKDPEASIFKTAHYCIEGDLYEIIPKLINKIKNTDKEDMLCSITK